MYIMKKSGLVAIASMLLSISCCYSTEAEGTNLKKIIWEFINEFRKKEAVTEATTLADIPPVVTQVPMSAPIVTKTTAPVDTCPFICEHHNETLPDETTSLIAKANIEFKMAQERIVTRNTTWDETYSFNKETSTQFAALSDTLFEQAKTIPASEQNRQRLIDSAQATSKTCHKHAGEVTLRALTASRHALDTHGRLRAALCQYSCDQAFNDSMATMKSAYASATTKWEKDSLAQKEVQDACQAFSKTLGHLCDSLSADTHALPDAEERAEAIQSVDTTMALCKSYSSGLTQYSLEEPGCPDAINASLRLLATLKSQASQTQTQS